MSNGWSGSDLLLRQVHPSHCNGSVPNSAAFCPTPKDDDKLSVDDSRFVSAHNSWSHFVQNLGFKSAGTWGISFAEISIPNNLILTADPIVSHPSSVRDNPAHCLLDFSTISSK